MSSSNEKPAVKQASDSVDNNSGQSFLKRISWRTAFLLLAVFVLAGGYTLYKSSASNPDPCLRFEDSCLKNSKESTIVRLYYAILGRAPGEGDLKYWTPKLNVGTPTEAATKIAEQFIKSREFKLLHPELSSISSTSNPASNQEFVNTVYEQIFNKSPTAQATKPWTDVINKKAANYPSVVVGLVQSSEGKTALLNRVAGVLSVKKESLCLSRQGSRFDLTSSQNNNFKNSTISANTKIDATTAKWNGLGLEGKPMNWPIVIGGTGPGCWYGGRYTGVWNDRSPEVTWQDPYHHSGAMTIKRDNFLVEGFRAHNQGDGMRTVGGANNFHVKGVYMSDIHDDCFENDGLNSGITEGSLFDGCYSGFSAASRTGSGGANNTWRIENNLLRMKPFHTIYKPERYTARGCTIPSHHGLFKGWGGWYKPAPKIILRNNIFRADERPCSGTLAIPKEMNLAECSNNTMVWLGKGNFPYDLPDCIKVTTDKSVWDKAVEYWKKQNPSVAW